MQGRISFSRFGWAALLLLPVLFLLLFFFLPIGNLLLRGLASEAGLSLTPIIEIFESPYLSGVVWFTVKQALLSMLASVILGFPIAYLLSNYSFRGRRLIKSLLIVPFTLPPITVALGFMLIYGNSGLLNETLMSLFGLAKPPIRILYSLQGIVLAHAFYNAPIVARFLTSAWERLPRRFEESAESVGAPKWHIFFRITLPMLSPALLSGATLAFIYSFLSFPIVLALGGARFATLEAEIFRRAMVQIDYSSAASLAVLALTFALLFVLIYLLVERYYARRALPSSMRTLKPLGENLSKSHFAVRVAAPALMLLGGLFYLAPLLAILIDSLTKSVASQIVWTLDWYAVVINPNYSSLIAASPLQSILNSLSFAFAAMLIALGIGIAFSMMLNRLRGGWRLSFEALSIAPLAVSSVAFGLALLWGFTRPPLQISGTWLAIVLAHSILAIPFVIRAVRPALSQFKQNLAEAAQSLGASSFRVGLDIVLPLIKGSLLTAGVFAFAISIAEMSATILLAQSELLTMPVSVYYLLASRQFGAASAMSVLMMIVLAASFILIDRLGERALRV